MSFKTKASTAGHHFTMILGALMGPADRGDVRYVDHLRAQRRVKLALQEQQKTLVRADIRYGDGIDPSYTQLTA